MQCYVRARLESGEDVTGDADITIEVEGSPIEAKIRGKVAKTLLSHK